MISLSVRAASSLPLLVLILMTGANALWSPNTGFETDEQSYFFGSRALTDPLCYQRTLPRGTQTPIRVGYRTTVVNKNITMVTVNADRESIFGFNVLIESGAIGTSDVNFRLLGKSLLPYNVLFEFWCTP